MEKKRPTFRDIWEAKKIISSYLHRTPLYSYPQLEQILGAKVLIKHEDHQPTRSFKVRGGINLLAHLSPEKRQRGLITASTGNHALSIAYACRLFNAPATIVMPEGANPLKVKAVESQGAKIIFHGRIFDEAKDFALQLANEQGAHFVHPANEPHLIAGVGTYALEIFEDEPEVEVIIVPVGGGSGAINTETKVIAVQAEKAPAAYLSWRNRRLEEDKMETGAEGLQTRMGYELTQSILWDYLNDFILVSEEEMEKAILIYLENIRSLVEHAGAAPLAAAIKIKEQLRDKKVVLVLSGGNLAIESLRSLLTNEG